MDGLNKVILTACKVQYLASSLVSLRAVCHIFLFLITGLLLPLSEGKYWLCLPNVPTRMGTEMFACFMTP